MTYCMKIRACWCIMMWLSRGWRKSRCKGRLCEVCKFVVRDETGWLIPLTPGQSRLKLTTFGTLWTIAFGLEFPESSKHYMYSTTYWRRARWQLNRLSNAYHQKGLMKQTSLSLRWIVIIKVFTEFAPFKWALKSDASQGVETDTNFDVEKLPFEDLIPK